MRQVIALALIPIIATSPALAAPGVTTTSVNLRAGPGTSHPTIRTLPAGTAVDMGDCEDSGSWCAVTVDGQSGFVSGRYLEESHEREGWPRTYEVGTGRMVLFQPQFTEWADFKTIEALVAAQYLRTPDGNPVFGVIGLKGTTSYDEDAGEIVITGVTVTELNFSGLGRDDLKALAVETGKLLPTGPITVAEARVTASLAEQKRMTDVAGLKADPPRILVSTTPAILVQTDGAAAFAPVKGKAGLSFVVNTNWDLFRVDEGGALYLRDDTHWLTASTISGPWTPVTELPAPLKELPDDANWADARAAMPPEPYGDGAVPKVITTDAPAEMILFDGEPKLQDVPRTSLQWASNTEADVFFDKAGKQWYVLLAGRWFRAASLEGPWTFATPDLPADFLNLSEDAPYFAVRSSVPGTSEAAEARLKASIPTTARVEAGSITPTVAYAGDAQFAPVETTDLSYATNTTDTVIRVGEQYFLLQDGVWFVSDSPNGPWQLARAVPDAIYGIPPSSPVYNATYVRVYDTEPNAVWYGYTMGYLYGYPAWGTYVYGTGWSYPPYWYSWPGYAYPIYYPRPVTWGLAAYYNPIWGMYGRYGYAYGPYRGIAGVRSWNPASGTYGRAAAAWGPRGSAGFVGAYNPRTDGAGYVAGGRNVYGAWKSAGVKRGSEWARVAARDNAAGGSSLRWNTSNGQGFIREGRRGDIYAGRDGNVYRNAGDGWQRWDGGWQDVARPEPRELLQRGEGREGLAPEARERLQERAGGDGPQRLAGAGTAGAAGAALGQRLTEGSDRTGSDRIGGGAGRERTQERAAQRPAGERQAQQRLPAHQRPTAGSRALGQERTAVQERPASQQRPVQQRPAAQDRQVAQQRPASQQRSAQQRTTARERQVVQQRPAAQPRPVAQKPAQRPATRQPLPSNLTRDVQARHLGNQRQIASRQAYRPPSAQFSRSPASFAPQRSFAPRGGFGGGGFRGGGRR
ncbi:SH3 domain-containing protein [Microvirga sp. CF3016]|uniref:SH3 domain-containing protein n=1 Tax=Microvirga sp. CF3016 TaxID=3110181 RepID=UPI002E793814|nr:SH3 domain-containing protein [Microvirga sp. CF3016]MEE1609812.1 SH3 domain-containing protein [Microvirga sp. CF3016]